jgi:hypothetical protein
VNVLGSGKKKLEAIGWKLVFRACFKNAPADLAGIPQGLKPLALWALSARLKSRPDTKLVFLNTL